jgi:hypothetical protein
MASLKQIEANRRNAQKSTGPRTAEGKAVSRFNALKTGIDAQTHLALAYEDPKDLEALTVEYYNRFAPDTPDERCLVDALISDEWSLRRFRAVEGQVIQESHKTWGGDERSFAESYQANEKLLLRLQRRIDSTGRSYLRTLDVLRKLQAERPPERLCEQPERIPPASANPLPRPPLTPAIGFVPSSSPVSPSTPTPNAALFRPSSSLLPDPPRLARLSSCAKGE